VVTDGAGVYKTGIRKSFWDKVRMGECKIIRKPGLRAKEGKLSNNIIERFHNTLKERYKTMRDFGSFDGARNALDGFVIQYNYLRPHMALMEGLQLRKRDWNCLWKMGGGILCNGQSTHKGNIGQFVASILTKSFSICS